MIENFISSIYNLLKMNIAVTKKHNYLIKMNLLKIIIQNVKEN